MMDSFRLNNMPRDNEQYSSPARANPLVVKKQKNKKNKTLFFFHFPFLLF
jgi:hypothetical protein